VTVGLGIAEQGCLLLADITGYTQYMGGTELTHAEDVVSDLLETIVGSIEPAFQLSKLEGDAAFAYAALESVNPSMMLDTVESAYFGFQQRLRDIAHATACECNACIRIPDLDLKFFVHDGEYVVRRIARSEELTGPDVILVHRLAKGTAGTTIGRRGYAVYTKPTLDAMAMDPAALGFLPHTEEFTDVGRIEVFVQDLQARWAMEQERSQEYVTEADAVHQVSIETAAAPQVVWDHLTDPVKRLQWQRHVTDVLPMTEGRRGVGSINHCMHGPDVIVEHVADWRPFSYLTLRYKVAGIEDWAWTYRLESVDGATRLTMLVSDPGGGMWDQVGPVFEDTVREQAANLLEVLGRSGGSTPPV
jgi:hypothetical protein